MPEDLAGGDAEVIEGTQPGEGLRLGERQRVLAAAERVADHGEVDLAALLDVRPDPAVVLGLELGVVVGARAPTPGVRPAVDRASR